MTASQSNAETGNAGTGNNVIARVQVNEQGHFLVTPVGAAASSVMFAEIAATFNMFWTRPLTVTMPIVNVCLSISNVLYSVPIEYGVSPSVKDIAVAQNKCRWIVDRLNIWPRGKKENHDPQDQSKKLFGMKELATKDITVLTKVGQVFVHDLQITCHYIGSSSVPAYEKLARILTTYPKVLSLQENTDHHAYYVYVDDTSQCTLYIGCGPAKTRDGLRRALVDVARLYNADPTTHNGIHLKAEILINVACVTPETSTARMCVQRVTWSDNTSAMVCKLLSKLLKVPKQTPIKRSAAGSSMVYVDRVGRVYICPTFDSLMAHFPAAKQSKDASDPKDIAQPGMDSVADTPSAKSVESITDKNKRDDIDIFFSTLDPTTDWKDRLGCIVQTQPTHIVEEVFLRAPDRIKMSMDGKVKLLVKCLEANKAGMARLLLDRFDMDANTMVDCNVKWGDLTMFDPHFCKELIERFHLPATIFSNHSKVLGIKSVSVLRWIVDRFEWSCNLAPSSQATYLVVRDNLCKGTLEVFMEYMAVFSRVVSKDFERSYVNDQERENLLVDCLLQNKLTHFDFLVEHCQVSRGTIGVLFKNIVSAKPAHYWSTNTLKHVLSASQS